MAIGDPDGKNGRKERKKAVFSILVYPSQERAFLHTLYTQSSEALIQRKFIETASTLG